jgi:hypothetical protein
MPPKFSHRYKARFFRKGPFLKSNTGLRQVEGNATQAFNASISGMDTIPSIVSEQAHSIVKEFTEQHSIDAANEAGRFDVGTGALSGGFETDVTRDRNGSKGVSKNKALHAIFQELGFHHWRNGRYINPKPFMFPPFARSKEAFRDRLKEIFGK